MVYGPGDWQSNKFDYPKRDWFIGRAKRLAGVGEHGLTQRREAAKGAKGKLQINADSIGHKRSQSKERKRWGEQSVPLCGDTREPFLQPSTLNPQSGIDFEQEQTESTERRPWPEKPWNEWLANALSATPLFSVPSVPSCEMTSEFGLRTDPALHCVSAAGDALNAESRRPAGLEVSLKIRK
jgi:hypothetical protein